MRVALLPHLAAICAVAATAAACADDQAPMSSPPPAAVTTGAPTPAPTAPTTSTAGEDAPASTITIADTTTTGDTGAVLAASYDWEAPLIGGGSISLRDLGDRDVLLWFWAPY